MNTPLAQLARRACAVSFLLASILGLLAPCPAAAQAITESSVRERTITTTGVIKDQKTRRPIGNVNVFVPGTNIGTVTNSDGAFSLKLKDSGAALQIAFSYLGYQSNVVEIDRRNATGNEYYLQSSTFQLNEILITPIHPRLLVEEAIANIRKNYNPISSINTLFYRETVQKRRRYIDISEAVSQSYKTAYTGNGSSRDRVRILKGRRLMSPSQKDTLSVKLEGGPNLATFTDVVKNPDILLGEEYIDFYNYSFHDFATIDDRLHIAIAFKPKPVMLDFPLYQGIIYIDRESKGISRIEFSTDMSDESKVTRQMLRKKPAGLRFRPQSIDYVTTYRYQDGRFYLNYIRAEFKFRCDWKRRLFATNYTVRSEMVVTNRIDQPIESITYRESFRRSDALSDKVMDFYDETFWEDYNIIEPTESLEDAVKKLRKVIDKTAR